MAVKLNILKNTSAAQGFIKLFYIVGILGLSFPKTQLLFFKITPISILLIGLLLFWHQQKRKVLMVGMIVILCTITFFIEVIGVKTGLLFGNYTYGSSLGIKVFDVPIVIGFNWAVLLYCTHVMVKQLRLNILLHVLLASLLMVVFDFVLEPAAMAMDMWQWNLGTVPIVNYIAWFIVSVVMHIVLFMSKLQWQNPLAGYVYLVQLVFFIVLDINLVYLPRLL